MKKAAAPLILVARLSRKQPLHLSSIVDTTASALADSPRQRRGAVGDAERQAYSNDCR
jgi:hypothetical protein